MKKNKMMRIASVLLVAVLLSTSVISGTFAKYTSTSEGSDTARVAKWSFNVGEENIALSNTFTFELFNTLKDSNGTDAETDISDTTGAIIAPGTSGSFDIVLTNTSEVTARYAIDYTVTNSENIPVEFCVDGEHWLTTLEDVAADDTNTKLAHTSGTTTITVQWRWAFSGNDTTDTGLGTLGENETVNDLPTITVEATVTVEQMD